jgi:hypothetical protein
MAGLLILSPRIFDLVEFSIGGVRGQLRNIESQVRTLQLYDKLKGSFL